MARPKGSPNKVPRALREMILGALDKAGGEGYLVAQAKTNPAAFMTLIGKVLPMTVAGDKDSPLNVNLTQIVRKIVEHAHD